MTRDESIALWLDGKDIWNEWANGMLAERKRLEDAGEWEAEKLNGYPITGNNKVTKKWIEKANVDFSVLWLKASKLPRVSKQVQDTNKKERKVVLVDHHFLDFKGFQFPNDTTFKDTIFDGMVFCTQARFNGFASFNDSVFKFDGAFTDTHFCAETVFNKTRFCTKTYFTDAFFNEVTQFHAAEFNGESFFGGGTFKSKVSFSGSYFKNCALFKNAVFEGYCYFTRDYKGRDCQFEKIADFNFAHF